MTLVQRFATVAKPGVDLEAGDAIQFDTGRLHAAFYQITHFKHHPGFTDARGNHHSARIACAGDQLAIVVFDDEDYAVLAALS